MLDQVPVKDVVMIAYDLHPKSEEALQNLLKWLETDYDIKDEKHPGEGYYATIKESILQDVCKCDYCNHYNTVAASRCHGYSCSNCGKVLYKEYVPRARIRFSFKNDSQMWNLTFIIHSYDDKTQRLLVYAKPQKNKGFFGVRVDEVPEFLKNFEKDFERVEINGKKLLSFYLPSRLVDYDNVKINISEVGQAPYKKVLNLDSGEYVYQQDECDRKFHYQRVQIYKGQEITEKLPVRESFSVVLSYKHAPIPRDSQLSRKIIRAARQVSDCGYYYQDGSCAFCETHFEWMARYVEHFTDLEIGKFREFLATCRNDGPGFICQLAEYIQQETGVQQYVENRPNIGNLVVGVHKILNKELPNEHELTALGQDSDDVVRLFKEPVA